MSLTTQQILETAEKRVREDNAVDFLKINHLLKNAYLFEASENNKINILCSDTFALGGGDCEEIPPADLPELYSLLKKLENTNYCTPDDLEILYIANKRNMKPHPRRFKHYNKGLTELLNFLPGEKIEYQYSQKEKTSQRIHLFNEYKTAQYPKEFAKKYYKTWIIFNSLDLAEILKLDYVNNQPKSYLMVADSFSFTGQEKTDSSVIIKNNEYRMEFDCQNQLEEYIDLYFKLIKKSTESDYFECYTTEIFAINNNSFYREHKENILDEEAIENLKEFIK